MGAHPAEWFAAPVLEPVAGGLAGRLDEPTVGRFAARAGRAAGYRAALDRVWAVAVTGLGAYGDAELVDDGELAAAVREAERLRTLRIVPTQSGPLG